MASPRLTQFSHGCDLLHLSLRKSVPYPLEDSYRNLGSRIISRSDGRSHFLFRHGAHDNGTLFLFLTTRYCPSGENWPLLVDVVDGGVEAIFGMVESFWEASSLCRSLCLGRPEGGTQANPKFIRPSALEQSMSAIAHRSKRYGPLSRCP